MLEIIAERADGTKLPLSPSVNYIVTSVTGILPAPATVNTSTSATMDGAVFNSARVNDRNIVITLLPVGNVENARIGLYGFFKPKQSVKLYLNTASRQFTIEGYVDKLDGDVYAQKEVIQISIICPDPYFKRDTTQATVYQTKQASFWNRGDIPIGFIARAQFTAEEGATSFSLIQYDHDSGDTIGEFYVDYNFLQGDELILNTNQGQKGVWLLRENVKTSILNYMDLHSKWFQIPVGRCDIDFDEWESGKTELTIFTDELYEGV